MLLERIIRQPESLDDAVRQFSKMTTEQGWEVLTTPHATWQNNLFTKQRDALVMASGRRKRTRVV